MSSADQSLKRMASPEAEESEPKKRQKQDDKSEVPSAPQQNEESATGLPATAHGEGAQTEGADSKQQESQKDNDEPDEVPNPQGAGTEASAGAHAEESQADSDTDSSTEDGGNESAGAQREVKNKMSAWMKTLNKFSTHGNNSGFFSEDLRKKGHNSRTPMLPDERRQLMADLAGQNNIPETQSQRTEGHDRTQSEVGLDFMSELSTAVDSPKDAAAFLGIDLQSLNISPESALRLRIDQVQNIAFMVKKAEGILRGCVNANQYGTGKTIEALASVFFLAQRRQACPDFDSHKAAFILCTHQALRGWQEAHAKYFSGLLTLRICSNSLPPGKHSEVIDPLSASALGAFLKTLSPSDPQTSRTVIISTYGELSSPKFLTKLDKEDASEKELSLRFSTLSEEALEALQVAQKPRVFDLKFKPKIIGTLIADEAHEIKHPKTNKAQAAYLLDADIHFLLTANPVDNKVSDVRGLLFALYKPEEWQIDWPRGEDFEALLKMFDHGFDPFKIKDANDSVLDNASPEYIQALRVSQHLWRLNPHAYRWLGHKMRKFGPEFSRKVLGSIFQLCLLRRGTVSVTTMPSEGSNTVSGILALPPMTIRTIEVSRGREEKDYEDLVGMNFRLIFRDDEKDSAASAARVANANEIPDKAFDNFWDTFLSHVTADLGLADVLRSTELSEAPASRYSLPDIETLQQSNTDCGMSFYYSMTRRATDPVQPPSDRLSMIRHLVRRSPKLRWLLVKLEELKHRGEKVVIYCVHPLTQWLVEGVCSMAEFNFLSLRRKPKHDDKKIAAVIDAFNNPAKRHDFLLSTFSILGFGVELHADCHNLIIFELPGNVPTIMSAIGRIRRMGQTNPQAVWILTMKDSYDDYTLHRQSRKHAISMLAFGVLGEPLDRLSLQVANRMEQHMLTLRREMSNGDETEFLKRLERATPVREVVQLLAAGELHRRHFGIQHNRSHIPWHIHQRSLFRPHGFKKMELSDFSGAEMEFNTETSGLILQLAARLSPAGTPAASMQVLYDRFENQEIGSDSSSDEETS